MHIHHHTSFSFKHRKFAQPGTPRPSRPSRASRPHFLHVLHVLHSTSTSLPPQGPQRPQCPYPGAHFPITFPYLGPCRETCCPAFSPFSAFPSPTYSCPVRLDLNDVPDFPNSLTFCLLLCQIFLSPKCHLISRVCRFSSCCLRKHIAQAPACI